MSRSFYRAVELAPLAAAALVAGALSSPTSSFAAAVINFPPPGSNAFIDVTEFDSGLSVCPQVQCQIISSPGVPLTFPTTTFTDAQKLNAGTVFGEASATALKASVASNHPAMEVDVAINDTYTVRGAAPGPFNITVTLHASGQAQSAPFGPFNGLLGEGVVLTIGTFDINPAALIPTVDSFGGTARATQSVGFLTGPITVPIDVTASFTKTVQVGDIFDIAYELTSSVVIGSLDVSHTATISFTTPDGVFLTSALGGEFGDVPTVGPGPSDVVEPSSLLLLGPALWGLGMVRGRRALSARHLRPLRRAAA
jgi:hypothetical protein